MKAAIDTARVDTALQILYNAERWILMRRDIRDQVDMEVAIAILRQAARDVLGVRSTQ